MRLHYNGQVYPLTEIENWSVTSKISGTKTLQFDIAPQSDIYRYIEEEGRIEYNGTYYNIKSINERRTISTVIAEIDLDGLRENIFQSFKTETVSLSETLEKALEGTGWSVSGAELVSSKRSMDLSDVTPLDIVNQCTNSTVYNVSFDVDNINQILNVSVPGTAKGNVYFTDQLNLKELNFKGSSSNFITRLYAYGKDGLSFADINDGKSYIDNNTYSNKVISMVWRDERYTVKENLLTDAKEKLASMAMPERSYTCTIVDLARLNKEEYADFHIRLNSIVTLIDKRRKTRLEHTVVEMKEYPNEPNKNTVVLSTAPETLSKKLTNTSVQLDSISSAISKQPSVWEQAIQNATALITGQKGGYVVLNPAEKPSEILIMDTPDINTAVNLWRFNSGGLGHSSNGYNGPFPLAMTMDGQIVADFITAGTLNADIIKAGTLQGIKIIATMGSIAGWTMQDGVLVSNDGSMKLNSVNNTLTVSDDTGNALMTINKSGVRFWRNGQEIGKIGVTGNSEGTAYGLTFDLVDGDAMTWSVYDSESGKYVNKVRYTEKNGFVVHNNLSCDNFEGCELVKGTYTTADGQTINYWGWK